MKFLADRSPRERLLILIMLVLLGTFLIWQFLVSPVLGMRAVAESDRQAAIRDYEIVAQNLSAMEVDGSEKAAFTRNILIQEARAAGIRISRVQPQGEDAIKVWFEDAPALQVFTFLDDLSGRFDVSVTNAQINRRDGGTVGAQFTLLVSE
ncbi:MAG: type II secretion system protein M [Hyphomonadaceae bacterium]|nr:type II secretion system protein M [Hyphomonadaceae bacterium]MBC6412849.1 type II secretion system protein M [Hyphomonadaceae bacterium]